MSRYYNNLEYDVDDEYESMMEEDISFVKMKPRDKPKDKGTPVKKKEGKRKEQPE